MRCDHPAAHSITDVLQEEALMEPITPRRGGITLAAGCRMQRRSGLEARPHLVVRQQAVADVLRVRQVPRLRDDIRPLFGGTGPTWCSPCRR